MTTKTKRRAPRGASPDPKVQAELQQLREENAALRGELAAARLAVAKGDIDVTAFPTLAAAIRRLDESAHDFAVAADQRTTAKERECERLRAKVRRFAAMLGAEAVGECHAHPEPLPSFNLADFGHGAGFQRRETGSPLCRLRPEDVAAKDRVVDSGGVGSFRVRDGVLESLHGVSTRNVAAKARGVG